MMTKDFEKYFPLPWSIFFYGDGVHYIETDSDRGFWIMEEKGDGSTKRPDSAEGRAAMKYIVRSANLMPEAAALIKRWRDEKAKRREELCTSCANDEDGYMDSDECDTCLCKELDADIELADKLLAKLEGGADDEAH